MNTACELCVAFVPRDPKFPQRHNSDSDPTCPFHYRGEPVAIGDIYYEPVVSVMYDSMRVRINKYVVNAQRHNGEINFGKGQAYRSPGYALEGKTKNYAAALRGLRTLAVARASDLRKMADQIDAAVNVVEKEDSVNAAPA